MQADINWLQLINIQPIFLFISKINQIKTHKINLSVGYRITCIYIYV